MSVPFVGGSADLQQNTLVTNTLIRDHNARETVQVYKDTDGNRRIIIGKLPDGTYGLVISKEGYDVIDILEA